MAGTNLRNVRGWRVQGRHCRVLGTGYWVPVMAVLLPPAKELSGLMGGALREPWQVGLRHHLDGHSGLVWDLCPTFGMLGLHREPRRIQGKEAQEAGAEECLPRCYWLQGPAES